jgi:uncharacterized SAM-binding protein YcdF (DUF218 family)
MSPHQKIFGLFSRKERWGLSGLGWITLLALVVVGSYLLSITVFPFLAVTHRVNANVLVVEGWVHPYAIAVAVKEFKRGSYNEIFTTGGPVHGSGGYTSDYNTSAHVGEGLLRAAGVPRESIRTIPSRVIGRDRTYYSALALQDWFQAQNLEIRSVNVVTENVHARRTRLLFEKALGPRVAIGIIAAQDPDYDPKRWWHYSEGVRDVLGESIAYIYVKFFFHPKPPEARRAEIARPADGWRVNEQVASETASRLQIALNSTVHSARIQMAKCRLLRIAIISASRLSARRSASSHSMKICIVAIRSTLPGKHANTEEIPDSSNLRVKPTRPCRNT